MSLLDLAARLTLDASDYNDGLNNAEGTATSFGDKLKGGLSNAAAATAKTVAAVGSAAADAVKGMMDSASAAASAGDHIDKMSQKIGISSDAYQEWAFVMEHSGASVDSLQAGMKTLSGQIVKTLEDNEKYVSDVKELNEALAKGEITQDKYDKKMAALAEKNQAATDSFSKLGISLEDLSTLSNEDILAKTIEGLQGMGEGAERTKLATELLGRAGNDLGALFNTSAEETEAMKQQVHDLGGVMSSDAVKASAAYQDSMQNMQTALNGIKTQLSADFLPGMTSVMDGVTAILGGDASGADKISEGIKGFIANIQKNLPKIVAQAKDIVKALTRGIKENLPIIIKMAIELIKELINAFVDMLPDIIDMGMELIIALAEGLGDALPELIPKVIDAILLICDKLTEPDMIDKLIDAAFKIIDGLAKGLIKALPQLAEKVPQIITKIVTTLAEKFPEILSKGGEIVDELWNGIKDNLETLTNNSKEMIDAVIEAFADAGKALWDKGVDLIKGLWEGFKSWIGQFKKNVEDFVDDVVDSVKWTFGEETIREAQNQALADSVAAHKEYIKNQNLVKEYRKQGLIEDTKVGDITIPVYIGDDIVEELVVNAYSDYKLKNGGM